MKIISVDAVVVGARMRNWVFVKVQTDDGVTGWGEATTEWKTQSVVGAVRDLSPLLLGEDAFRIEHLWQSMHRHQFWKGGLVSMSALSGVDQALHDIKAQSLGVPIYELLGGRVRDEIRLYDHLGGGDPESVYGEMSVAGFAEAARRSVEDGFDAVKILAVPVGPGLPDRSSLRASHQAMSAVREAVGEDVEIMVDFHGRCTPTAALAFTRELRDFRPWFIEEPCPPEFIENLGQVASAGVPVALGERLSGRAEFLRVLRSGHVAVVQPDVCHAGGLSEMRRIAAMAETFGVVVAPHNPLGPIATAHNLHFAASTPNWIIQEQMRNAVPWYDEVVDRPLQIINGRAKIPSGPGLGLRVNEQVAAQYPYVPERQISATLSDGSVADW